MFRRELEESYITRNEVKAVPCEGSANNPISMLSTPFSLSIDELGDLTKIRLVSILAIVK